MKLAQSKKAYADKQQVNDKVLLRVRDQLFVYAALCSSVLVIHMQDCILVLSICEHISSSSVMACCQYLPGNYDPSTWKYFSCHLGNAAEVHMPLSRQIFLRIREGAGR